MDLLHDVPPGEARGVRPVDAAGRDIVARPDGGDVVGRHADEPAVVVAAGGAGLAGYLLGVEVCAGARAAVSGADHHVRDVVGRVRAQRLALGDGIVEHYAARGVEHLGIGAGLGVHAVVGEDGVGRRHLAHRDAVGQLAESERRGRVVAVHQVGEPEDVAQVVEARLYAELVEQLHGDGVLGADQALAYRYRAVCVAVAGVARIPVEVLEGVCLVLRRGVHDERVLRDEAEVEGRAVYGERLYGASGRARGVRGPVEHEVAVLLADAAGEGHDVACIGVEYDDGALELLGAHAAVGREVVRVLILRVDYGLDIGVHAGVNMVAAGVEQGLRRLVVDAAHLHEVGYDVVYDGLDVVGVYLLLGDLGLAALEVQLLVLGLGVLGVADVALLVHLAQDGLLPVLVVLDAVEGAVVRGQVHDADDAGALGERELAGLLAEVGLRRRVYAVAALAEVDGVEVPLYDFVLVVLLLELQRSENLHQLSLDGDLVLAGEVLDELLRYRGAAEVVAHPEEHIEDRADGAVPVHALVVVEALVLNGYEGVLEVLRYVLIVDPYAVLAALERREDVPVPVVDRARLAERVVVERDVQLVHERGLDVEGEDADEQQPRGQQDQYRRKYYLKRERDGPSGCAARGARGPARFGIHFVLVPGHCTPP